MAEVSPGHELAAAGNPQSPTSVQVVNTTSQPIPTIAQGSTTVAGTVSIGNTPTVNIATMPTVTVARSDAREPVYLTAFAFANGRSADASFAVPGQASYAVPPGKQLIVDQLAMACDFPTGGHMATRIVVGDGTNPLIQLPVQLPSSVAWSTGDDAAGVTIPFALHVSATHTLSLSIQANTSGNLTCNAALGGYYVADPPSAAP